MCVVLRVGVVGSLHLGVADGYCCAWCLGEEED